MICENYCKCEKCSHFYAEDFETFCNGYGDGSPFCRDFQCIEAECSLSTCITEEAILEVFLGL